MPIGYELVLRATLPNIPCERQVSSMTMVLMCHCLPLSFLQLTHCPEAIEWRLKAAKLEAELESYRRGEDGVWGTAVPSAIAAEVGGTSNAERNFERWWRLNTSLSNEVRQLQRDKRALEQQVSQGGAAVSAPSPSKAQAELAQWREKQRYEDEAAQLRAEVRDRGKSKGLR